jgi:DNA-directed RNA polymerase specialized sigma24 family protein
MATKIAMGNESDDDELGSVSKAGYNLHSPDAVIRDAAARQIYDHYARRLEGVFRRKLDPRILNAAGAEDLVQSLFADFFADPPARVGPPLRRGDLWRILVRYAVCKAADAAHYHLALCRTILRVQRLIDDDDDSSVPGARSAKPRGRPALTPDELVGARHEFDRLVGKLPIELRNVLLLRLDGLSNSEIAQRIDRVERTVEAMFHAIRVALKPYLE